jgi:hypothetical protein
MIQFAAFARRRLFRWFEASRAIAFGTLFLASLFGSDVEAKPRSVNLLSELKAAKVVSEVTIVSYEKDHLVCSSANDPKKKRSFKYSDDPAWNPTRFIGKDLSALGTGEWPPIGSNVAVVIDKEDAISLFAYRQGDAWRFWSPVMTGSVALFNCEPPAKPIKSDTFIHKYGSWDGCLLPLKEFERRQR